MAQNESEDELHRRLRRTPLTWDELKTIVLSPDVDDLSKLSRSVEQQRHYRKCREDIKKEWISIYDYILCTKFDFNWVWVDIKPVEGSICSAKGAKNHARRRKRSNPTHQEYLDSRQKKQQYDYEGMFNAQFALCPNDFPYYFETGVQHWVLWKLGGIVTSDEIIKAKLDIINESRFWGEIKKNCWSIDCMDLLQRGFEQPNIVNDHELFLHWVNPPHLKSLPGIDHVHILFRSDGKESITARL